MMQRTDNNVRVGVYALVSVAFSLILHVGLWVSAAHVTMPSFGDGEGDERAGEQRVELHTIDVRDRMFRPRSDTGAPTDATRELASTMEKARSIGKLFEDQQLIRPPKPELELRGLGRNLMSVKPGDAEVPKAAAAPRPEIVGIDAQSLSAARRSLERSRVTAKLDRKSVDEESLPSLITADEVQRATGERLGVGMRLGAPEVKPLELPPLDEGQDGTAARDGERETGGDGDDFSPETPLPDLPGNGNGSRDNGDIHHLDRLLSVSLRKRVLPSGGGFFRVDIQPNARSDRLLAIPKNILFILDCSASISNSKLKQFKASTLEALAYLNRHDRFNIISFRDEPSQLFEAPVPPGPQVKERVREYFEGLERGGKTDVYAGIAPFVQREDGARPLNVFIMTDGRSTVKNRLDNEAIVRQISSLNRNDISIYTFSAGDKANRFLLDMLAYTNRGVSLHESRLEDFRDQLVQFISSHSELIVEDLKYNVTGGMRESLYPKRLPHLYRGETLSIYGRYPPKTDELAIQIIGNDAGGKLEELVFRADLSRVPEGGRGIEIDWAAQHIFYLIARRTLNPSVEVTSEIRRLARQYNIYVPYL